MAEIIDQLNDKIAQRMQEEEVITTTEIKNRHIMGTSDIIAPIEEVIQPVYNQAGELKGAEVVKKTRTRVAKTVTTGKVDTKILIAGMKEKVAVIEWVDGAYPDSDIPTPLSAKAREVLIKLQKDVETAKSAAIQSIQSL